MWPAAYGEAVNDDRTRLLNRGLYLEYATLGWNVVEIGFFVYAAYIARSVALAGFAIDSFIEIFASVVVVWQLKGTANEAQERRAVRMIGGAFFLLAIYIAGQAIVTVAADIRPAESLLGIAWLAVTALVMFALAIAKGRTGRAIGNPVLLTESKVTFIDGALACAILLGLLLNVLMGWWWADIAAGFVLVAYGLYEGWHSFHE